MTNTRRRPARAVVASHWKTFWETPEGKIAIGALMAHFNVYGSNKGPDPVSPTEMAVAWGERKVADWIAEQIGVKPEQFVDQRNEVDHQSDKLVQLYGG